MGNGTFQSQVFQCPCPNDPSVQSSFEQVDMLDEGLHRQLSVCRSRLVSMLHWL